MPARYCEVALPVPLRSTFTYLLPQSLAAALDGQPLVGRRVVVPFRRRAMIGVVLAESAKAPEIARAASSSAASPAAVGAAAAAAPAIREIAEVMDPLPALPANLIELGEWISRYYLAPIGETFRSMLPPDVEVRHDREYSLSDAGRAYLDKLAQKLTLADAERAEADLLRRFDTVYAPETKSELRVRRKRVDEAAAEALVRRGYLAVRNVLRHRQARTQKILAWNSAAPAGELDARAEKIREALLSASAPLPLHVLIAKAGVSRPVVERLENTGVLSSWEEPLTPGEDPWDADFTPPSNVLNAEQSAALAEIWRWLVAGKFEAALLHGVTGSGKTEVYLGAIEATLSRGKSAIVLVPEIALTLWVGRLVRARFGEHVAVLHSGLQDTERAREWWRVRHGEARIVVGTRSAIFAPLENLGLIIVDEEQESSYKQEETPRYHGRDTAVYRARLEGAVALLGSATPSLETYHNARAGKYQLLQLTSRVENRPLAAVRIVDLREEFRREHRATPVSESLRASHRAAPRREDAGHGADQPPRLFLVVDVPQLRRAGPVRELQHRAHVSQEPPAPRMPLLRLFDPPAEAVPEMQFRVHVFRRRRRRARGGISARSISHGARSRGSTATRFARSANTSRCSARLRRAKSTFSWARRWSRRATTSSA